MRIGILSYYPGSKRSSTEELRLVKAARELGHQARIIRVSRCQLVYDGDHPSVLHEGKLFPKFDVIIPRASVLKNVELHTAIVKQFELMGIPVVNRSRPINRAKNKLHTMQVLNHHGIGVPKTIVLRSQKYLDWAIKQVGGFPVIMKTPFGSYGSGVVIAESKRALASSLDALWTAYEINIALIQEYIKESKGRDIRLFVVGRKVVATMMRAASKGEFRSNIELGGAGEKIEATPEEIENAIRATEVLGLEVSGVDLVRSNKGPLILEVNANPGFKKLEDVTGSNIARAIIEYAVSKVVKEEK